MQIAAKTGTPVRGDTRRLMLYARAAAIAVAAAFVLTVATGSGGETAAGRLGGDYPAFYAAGSIVADGDWDNLYEPQRQLDAQSELFGEAESSYLYFAYPPYVAALYRPLAALDYRASYALHTLMMVAAVVGALWLLRPVLRTLRDHFELAVIACVLFYPMLRAVTGGQNTGLTLLLLAGSWRALEDENEIAAGMCLGLLLYKPQFAVPLLALLLVRRAWSAVGAGVATGLVLWGVGTAVMGAGWLGSWWTQVSEFATLDAEVNGHNAVSWLGFAEGLLGAGSVQAAVIAVPLMLATAAGLVLLWRSPEVGVSALFAVTMAAIVLLSPHAMFYDVGLLALTGVVLIDRFGRAAIAPVTIGWALAWSQLLAPAVGFAPLFLVLVGGAVWFIVARSHGGLRA